MRNMKRFLTTIALFLLVLVCGGVLAHAPSAVIGKLPVGAVVLRVEVLETTYTDLRPVSDCPEGKQCIEMSGWARYRARVKEVISGDFDKTEVVFGRIQHASFSDKVTRDCYVVLHAASPNIESKIGVPFVLTKLLSNVIELHRAQIVQLLRNP